MDFSFQLYSARNFPPVSDVLAKLANLGYAQVEGFGGLYKDADELASALKANGLEMPTGHFGLDQLKDTDTAMKTAETLGIAHLYCPAVPPEQRVQPEGAWSRLAETLGELAETYRKAGFGFGWHNHDFEFRPTDSGKMPLEIILEGAPDLAWECDVAWVVRGDQDPLAWIRRYADRVNAIHVKDIAPAGECADEDGWADVGHGTMDWQRIMDTVRAETKCRYFVMEHDNPSDVMRFATRSIEAANKLGD